jgi:hypothetical protein
MIHLALTLLPFISVGAYCAYSLSQPPPVAPVVAPPAEANPTPPLVVPASPSPPQGNVKPTDPVAAMHRWWEQKDK